MSVLRKVLGGLPAGTYFIKITAGSSGATGLFVLEWEDLD